VILAADLRDILDAADAISHFLMGARSRGIRGERLVALGGRARVRDHRRSVEERGGLAILGPTNIAALNEFDDYIAELTARVRESGKP
jgi:hypothetical protein